MAKKKTTTLILPKEEESKEEKVAKVAKQKEKPTWTHERVQRGLIRLLKQTPKWDDICEPLQEVHSALHRENGMDQALIVVEAWAPRWIAKAETDEEVKIRELREKKKALQKAIRELSAPRIP